MSIQNIQIKEEEISEIYLSLSQNIDFRFFKTKILRSSESLTNKVSDIVRLLIYCIFIHSYIKIYELGMFCAFHKL